MLVALDSSGIRTLANLASKGGEYKCPVCHEDVVLKQGQIKIHHYAHFPSSSCENAGESYRHMEMKWQISQLFKMRGELRGGTVAPDFEVPYQNRRADVLISFPPFEQSLIVECQESPINFNEILNRTADYRDAYNVAWVFDFNRMRKTKRWGEFRIPKEIRQFHERFKEFNALNHTGNLFHVVLNEVSKREYKWEGETYCYTPSTIFTPFCLIINLSSGDNFMGMHHFTRAGFP